MAMPAAYPLQKRYTAGNCVLEAELQLSALSQWTPQPIVRDLHFRLWMQTGADDIVGADTARLDEAAMTQSSLGGADSSSFGSPVLIAQGDRAALQEISQYISQQVRSLLAVAQLSDRATRPAAIMPPPASLVLPHPLGYLALCDLNSVLHQCEQTTALLPVALSVAATDVTVESPVNTSAASGRVINLNNVIPFSRGRRRSMLWASSAAAALLAVGLTTTLWSGGPQPSSQQASSELADSDQTGSQQVGTEQAGSEQVGSEQADSGTRTAKTAPANGETGLSSAPEAAVSATSPNLSSDAIPRSGSAPTASGDASSETRNSKPATGATQAPRGSNETQNAPSAPPTADGSTTVRRDSRYDQNSAEVSRAQEPSEMASPSDSLSSASGASGTALESNPSPINQTTADSAAGSAEIATSQAAAPPASARQTLNTAAQIQQYFQTKWQAVEAPLSEPLSYEMQLSETGEVIRFVGLNSAAQTYRDRLFLDNESSLIFPLDPNSSGLSFRLDILPNGQVQVSSI